MKLIAQFAQSRSLESLCRKYGCPIALGLRPFEHEQVRRLCMRASLLIKHYRFGHGLWAINAAFILEMGEPLENLAFEDISTTRMRVLLLFYEQRYEEAARLLAVAETRYGKDSVLRCMRGWLEKGHRRD